VNITYIDLLKWIQTMSLEELKSNVSVYHAGENEYHPVTRVEQAKEDVLDSGHPFIVIGE
jgi:hypothetical protein